MSGRFGGKNPYMKSKLLLAIAATLATCAPSAFGQVEGVPAEGGQAAVPPIGTTQVSEPARGTVIPALTPVRIEVLAALGSKTSKSLDSFPIRLVEPIIIDGKEVVPAGTTGMGEVVHAKKSGGMGAAGELVLAARFLEVGVAKLPLRSMKLARAGDSSIETVNAINVASAASFIPVSVIGFFITGGQVVVPEGTIAEAKTAADFEIAPVADATGNVTQDATTRALPDDPGQPAIEPGDQLPEE